MRIRLGRRTATATAVAALVAGGLGMASGSASASSNVQVWLNGTHGVGVYSGAASDTPKVADDLFAPASVHTDCFVSGQSINNQGNVWYHVYQEHYKNNTTTYQYGYVYAPYVDDSNAFRNGLIRCPWKP
ncbi:hypothetical protein [Streptomyces sp. YS-3]|uniref:hypothetical protein n=1 Tax=Streptomyces sp. YS-3 TaxID=3381352 RepID=UPI00386223AA